ncbi:hypothetical protein PVAP13_2KG271820 [Panicum virgatum]|nr:hypothetical protein PVAP13_2KG271820 [Panicum virgatum]KAG2642465.1 hypothetical protein PVAP13_2KG271820 [Panicum virgatum]KAG2642466.1 hypothetical protein PVAP13_2KG271820 [Panicum virgatum]
MTTVTRSGHRCQRQQHAAERWLVIAGAHLGRARSSAEIHEGEVLPQHLADELCPKTSHGRQRNHMSLKKKKINEPHIYSCIDSRQYQASFVFLCASAAVERARLLAMAAIVHEEAPPLTHAENEEFLRVLRDVRQWVGREPPEKVEVVFDGVSVEAEERVGRRALPTLPNAVFNAVKAIVDSMNTCATQKGTFKIINEVSGTIRPSRMTLVLGAPGSGKTTFLRALAGKLDSSLKLQGKVFYNGKSRPSTPHYLCSYVSQHDLHHAEMTVREIINFSSNLLGSNNEFEILGDAIERNTDTNKVYKELFSKATKLGSKGSNLKTNYIIK